MSKNLQVWASEFGQAYTDRNIVDWRIRLPAFRQIVGGLDIKRVLEVGCNRGHNLVALNMILGDSVEIVGIEPNPYALDIARASSQKIRVLPGNVYDLPFKNEYFDLVFTSGVLIHIPLENLSTAMSEIYRVSRRYVLAIEYWAEEETTIPYRGFDDMLWKRNFLEHYQSQFHDLVLVQSGFCGPEEGFDRAHWWLLEKSRNS